MYEYIDQLSMCSYITYSPSGSVRFFNQKNLIQTLSTGVDVVLRLV